MVINNSDPDSALPQELPSPTQSHQQILIQKVRTLVQDLIPIEPHLKEDFYLLQWLKARKMKPDVTAAVIRTAVKWRQENGCYDISPDEELWTSIPQYDILVDNKIVDKNGDAASYAPMGSWNVRRFVEELGREAFVKFMTRGFLFGEKMMVEASRRRNAAILSSSAENPEIQSVGITLICDGSGYSFKQFASVQTILAAMDCAKIYDSYFPRNVDNVYFINAGSFFSKILRMVQPFIGVAKMEIFSSSDSYKPILHSVIDRDQLPKILGGTKADLTA